MSDFYARASALRDKYQTEINLTFHKLTIQILDDLSVKPYASLPGYYSRKNVLSVQCLFS